MAAYGEQSLVTGERARLKREREREREAREDND